MFLQLYGCYEALHGGFTTKALQEHNINHQTIQYTKDMFPKIKIQNKYFYLDKNFENSYLIKKNIKENPLTLN